MAFEGPPRVEDEAAHLQPPFYELRVVQQPIRARMCGYGDKDRRPITPPLVVKLECNHRGRLLENSEVDASRLILAADLRHPVTLDDANLVPPNSALSSSSANRNRQTRSPTTTPLPSGSTSPSVTSRSASASPAPVATPAVTASGLVSFEEDQKPIMPDSPEPGPASSTSMLSSQPNSTKKRRRSPRAESLETFSPPFDPRPEQCHSSNSVTSHDGQGNPLVEEPSPNLIGTLHANSYNLTDLNGEKGIFFVLPDLSVRTEGFFRLRLRLLSIDPSNSLAGQSSPVVATTHSNEFQVFSAKKFPGMFEPTTLSRHFAAQGVRIPTRQSKSGANKNKRVEGELGKAS
ncbi:hypothetical protein JCM16303_004585 [Sporobolomyces ruberrimus]